MSARLTAQTTPAPIPVLPAAQATAAVLRDVVLPEGTDFWVVTADEITSKTANKDDYVAIRTEEPVVIGNQVVIAKGAFVRAIVADVKRAGHLGQAGTLSIKVESTSAYGNDVQYPAGTKITVYTDQQTTVKVSQ